MTISITTEFIRKTLYPIEVIDTPDILKQYAHDTLSCYDTNAAAILFPENTEQVQNIVQFAKKHHLKLIPSGGRTGMTGGATAIQHELIISMDKMNHILSINKTERLITCQPGVILQTLHEYVELHRLFYPITLAAKGSCQIGGTIATNAGGVHVVKYGNTRQWVAGLKIITGNGDYLDLNSRGLMKNNTGYALHELIIGSEGTLGIITEVTLRLTQLPKKPMTLLLSHDSLHHVMTCFNTTKQSITLLAFEFFDQSSLNQVMQHQTLQQPFQNEAPFYTLIEWEATPDSEELVFQLLEKGLSEGWVSDGVFSQNETQREQFWQYREHISEALRQDQPYKYDLSIPIASIPDFYEQVMPLFQQDSMRLQSAWFGHIGDGNIHLNVFQSTPNMQTEFYAKCEKLNQTLFAYVKKYGGSISAEHGIGLLKKPYLSFSRSASEVKLMQQIKTIFDPYHLLNPGKIFDMPSDDHHQNSAV
ncbi:MAG: FAD-binding oxidoreductase [Endozoicomonadaceae bacterium]|nr:FAD-binding oxidoreductase [Endozoicomonadaceae bacterium]